MGYIFNIVYCHIELCFNHARIAVVENISPDVAPSREYIEKLEKTADIPEVSLGILTELDKRIQGKSESTEYDWLIRLISYDQGIHPDDRKNYQYAIRYAPTLIKMWQSNYQIEDTENVPVYLMCAVIQEIYWCRKNTPQISLDYMDYKNGKKSMLNVLPNPGEADYVLKYAWIVRLENRLCVNAGARERLQLQREIEHTIYNHFFVSQYK